MAKGDCYQEAMARIKMLDALKGITMQEGILLQ